MINYAAALARGPSEITLGFTLFKRSAASEAALARCEAAAAPDADDSEAAERRRRAQWCTAHHPIVDAIVPGGAAARAGVEVGRRCERTVCGLFRDDRRIKG